MKKILLITTLISFSNSFLKAAEESEEIEAVLVDVAVNLLLLDWEKECCINFLKEEGYDHPLAQEKRARMQDIEAEKADAKAVLLRGSFHLLSQDNVSLFEKVFKAVKSMNMLSPKVVCRTSWPNNQQAFLPFAAFTVHVNETQCIPLLRILEASGIDLTLPAYIEDENEKVIVDVTNALEIAKEQNNTAVCEFLLHGRTWSLEDAKKKIEALQQKKSNPQQDLPAAAAADDATTLEQMLAEAALDTDK